MELEEAILKIQDIKKEYCTMDGLKEYVIAIDKVLKYIKEESIPRAKVIGKIKVIQQRIEEETRTDFLITLKILENELQEILNKGEKDG